MTTIEHSITKDLYRCHHCSALNDAALNEWCLCAGGEQTLICMRCGHCFCNAPSTWKSDFWRYASAALIGRRREEKLVRSKFVARTGQPVRPVILLVDDDRLVHSIVDRVLAESGFRATLLHAYDGPSGLQMARKVRPELVFTDALLPVMDGRELCRALKSSAETRAMRVVIMTSLYKGTRYRNEAMRDFGADAFIEKPVSASVLCNVIADLAGPLAVRTAVAS